ncbi:MAG: hypothetical protein ACYCZV_12815, partial [Acidimicrobiales bacterium]
MTADPNAGPGVPPERQELEAERDFLLRSIRDLQAERETGEIEEADFAALNDSYTARAGRVLRRLQSLDAAGVGAGAVWGAEDTTDPTAHTTDPTADTTDPTADTTDPTAAAVSPGPGSGRPPLRRRLARRPGMVVAAGLVLLGLGAGLLVYGSTGARQVGQTASGSVPLSPAQE